MKSKKLNLLTIRIQNVAILVLLMCCMVGARDLYSFLFGFLAGLSFFTATYAKEILAKYQPSQEDLIPQKKDQIRLLVSLLKQIENQKIKTLK